MREMSTSFNWLTWKDKLTFPFLNTLKRTATRLYNRTNIQFIQTTEERLLLSERCFQSHSILVSLKTVDLSMRVEEPSNRRDKDRQSTMKRIQYSYCSFNTTETLLIIRQRIGLTLLKRFQYFIDRLVNKPKHSVTVTDHSSDNNWEDSEHTSLT